MNMMSSFVEYKEMKNTETNGEKKLINRRLLCSGIVLGALALMFLAVFVLSRVL